MNNNFKSELFDYFKKQNVFDVTILQQPRKNNVSFTGLGNHRSVALNEIVIEHDSPNKQRALWCSRMTIARLRMAGYNFFVYSFFGRSPHIHVYNINGLNEQSFEFIKEYKRQFLKKYSPFPETDIGVNTSKNHLIASEFKKHYKHGNVKKLIIASDSLFNRLEPQLFEATINSLNKLKFSREPKKRVYVSPEEIMWFIRWVSREKLPYGRWHNVIAKNVGILIDIAKLDLQKVLNLFEWGDRTHIIGWYEWAKDEEKEFNLGEIINYCNEYGIDLNEKIKRYSKNDT